MHKDIVENRLPSVHREGDGGGGPEVQVGIDEAVLRARVLPDGDLWGLERFLVQGIR